MLLFLLLSSCVTVSFSAYPSTLHMYTRTSSFFSWQSGQWFRKAFPAPGRKKKTFTFNKINFIFTEFYRSFIACGVGIGIGVRIGIGVWSVFVDICRRIFGLTAICRLLPVWFPNLVPLPAEFGLSQRDFRPMRTMVQNNQESRTKY